MGYDDRPIPERRRGDSDLPAVLVGFTPSVHAASGGVPTRLGEVWAKLCIGLTILFFVIVPTLGVLNLLLTS